MPNCLLMDVEWPAETSVIYGGVGAYGELDSVPFVLFKVYLYQAVFRVMIVLRVDRDVQTVVLFSR